VFLAVLLHVFIYVILAMVFRKKHVLKVPVTYETAGKRRNWIGIGWVLALGIVALFVGSMFLLLHCWASAGWNWTDHRTDLWQPRSRDTLPEKNDGNCHMVYGRSLGVPRTVPTSSTERVDGRIFALTQSPKKNARKLFPGVLKFTCGFSL